MTTLVLVPGLLSDDDLYADQRAALEVEHHVVVPDLTGGTSIAGMARTVLEAAPGRFALVGLSMGGYVALEVMRQAGGQVDALALLDTSARPESAAQTARRRQLLGLADEGGIDAVLDELWTSEVHRTGDAGVRARWDGMGRRCGVEVFRRQTAAIVERPDSRGDLAGLAVPTLVLCGRQDAITPLDGHVELAEAVPGADLVVLGDCGHLSTWDRPDAVTAALRAWLERAGLS